MKSNQKCSLETGYEVLIDARSKPDAQDEPEYQYPEQSDHPFHETPPPPPHLSLTKPLVRNCLNP